MRHFMVTTAATLLLSGAASAQNMAPVEVDQTGRTTQMESANGRHAGHVEHRGNSLYVYDRNGKLVGVAPVPTSLNPLLQGTAEPMARMRGPRRT